MIQLTVGPPKALEGFLGEYETTGRASIRSNCNTSGTEAERFEFRRHVEQIGAILNSLQEIGATASVTCTIRDGVFQVSGNVRLWFNGAQDHVIRAMRYLNDHGWQAARASKRSDAELHVIVIKTVLTKRIA